LKRFKPNPEDHPIYYDGNLVGYYISTEPWLHNKCWTMLRDHNPIEKEKSPTR